MQAATLTSPRLQRVLILLSDGRPYTTRQIVRRAHVIAVNAIMSERRQNGAEVTCVRQLLRDRWVYYYTMTKGPPTWPEPDPRQDVSACPGSSQRRLSPL